MYRNKDGLSIMDLWVMAQKIELAYTYESLY